MTDLPDAAACERIFHDRLSVGDAQGVHAALTIMALTDPHRAQLLLDATRLALTMSNDELDAAKALLDEPETEPGL